jgi:hypothetical protein
MSARFTRNFFGLMSAFWGFMGVVAIFVPRGQRADHAFTMCAIFFVGGAILDAIKAKGQGN